MGLYSGKIERAKAYALNRIPRAVGIWFFVFISVVYLGNGYLYTVEIPRLVIFLVLFLSLPVLILSRYFLHAIYSYYTQNQSEHRLVIGVGNISPDFREEYKNIWNEIISTVSVSQAIESIRKQQIDTVLMGSDITDTDQKELLTACRIYGIIPRIIHLPDTVTQTTEIEFVGRFPTVLVKFVRIEIWGRILKRTFDIILSSTLIVILAPVFAIISLAIFLEDRTGPIIYKNVRVGRNGKLFTLYKFRYMYWKFCVKEAYGVSAENDDALALENSLAQSEKNTRSGPIYKIQGDERKMRIGKIIESISLDELPQLFNVFIGDMSLVGPRPHQPREVEKYDEWHKQVLTIKPGITGMAQVYAREAQDFNNEVKLDRFYIENWSWILDIKLLIKTGGVIWV